ncbi:hypothetical protein A2697_04085 [Candidatus Curtissbacteria bacterium RIFCSPHIGHO2_01_FULL_41_44]|uniref:Transposase IS200-like domain-containing protein n=1 Tax=Candidatus Curtissbacteria bacterium RIFCSPLOWO2_01_FULL_42_50 TaxID=1797730 RepID=A0A1F5H2Z7_9BACT|nr:MAG: hypothetical protein A2697_04085 [Candidatus Curtissbacteria bacterium RIFCSPHIGHO2_01_FULL_41_44]OGD92892.1 MAG: hypothetical protein A3C33_02175 [Candidatus Curtissbacteria bacterium RIFCSPHIGHO2_02_FULL_42_58]OGD96624.1 MAG: hypothetical protein A3E71_00665 [Candidatus Curtissbacteria bacterium RIFCSPHIGHO2_12_FULL_42_33]OGD98532.1 MAG: hypothetical protein A3B54_00325 [Candidatus Curtissbacteria bacterium RIFCSPLOWO2_01_FULL_42_50]OGE02873.1 MAG: hypothetical protein A3G16_04260 [Ca
MPRRRTPLISGEIYHVFNRSIAKQPIFLSQKDYSRAIDVINFYRYQKPPLRFSHFNRLTPELKKGFLENLANKEQLVEILAFCIMPNHVHFLLKQLQENSISKFMNNFQHSYSKYFNTKNERLGSLFQAMFKAVRIETEEQLLHVSRYIHLNPVSSFLIKIEQLESYPWSSLKNYENNEMASFVKPKDILAHFKTYDRYKEFVVDQSNYQQELEKFKHLTFE